jgi:cysteinyl-tRNA synthetase
VPIRLHDSLTRELRALAPSADGVFRFYNCGPTVYGPAHIGNFRTFLVNDVIRRLAELEFGATNVRHVRNLTDVDDKTIQRARAEGRPLAEVTRQWTEKFHADCIALNCLPPHEEPRATGHIREQMDMIAKLIAKEHAYQTADGSVYFKVNSFGNYGALSRLKERELQPGATLKAAADADEKEDGSDFAMWKAWKPEDGDNAWESPWGRGRPGWHIECSAMGKKLLGDTMDLHTGGVDLLFPHHENEIAQSQCCNGATLARHWYHSEHLLVDGKKMSRSLGNIHTLDDLTAKGFSPMAVRYALLAGHPRKQLNFTLDSLHAAESALATLRAYRAGLSASAGAGTESFAGFWSALRDDLNVPAALGALFTVVKGGPANVEAKAFDGALYALGLKLDDPRAGQPVIPASVEALAARRWAAKQAKDFKAADALRAELAAAGWTMLDGKDGYRLEPLKR